LLKNVSIFVDKNYSVNKKLLHIIIGKLKNEFKFLIASFDINIINSVAIREINKKYLNHTYSTDIITFNFSGDNHVFDGEIFISIEDAKINAKNFKCSIDEEILRLVIHGILHMLGYDDIHVEKKKEMRKIENYLVEKYRVTMGNEVIIYDS
jgi:probable rRNA maturation factor